MLVYLQCIAGNIKTQPSYYIHLWLDVLLFQKFASHTDGTAECILGVVIFRTLNNTESYMILPTLFASSVLFLI